MRLHGAKQDPEQVTLLSLDYWLTSAKCRSFIPIHTVTRHINSNDMRARVNDSDGRLRPEAVAGCILISLDWAQCYDLHYYRWRDMQRVQRDQMNDCEERQGYGRMISICSPPLISSSNAEKNRGRFNVDMRKIWWYKGSHNHTLFNVCQQCWKHELTSE